MKRIGEVKRRKALEIFAEYEKRDHNVSYEGMVTRLAGKYHYNRDYLGAIWTHKHKPELIDLPFVVNKEG